MKTALLDPIDRISEVLFGLFMVLTFTGTLNGKPWSMAHSPTPQSVLIKGYLRLEGIVDVPPSAMVKNVTARVLQGSSVRSVQTFQL